jgi:hypothetical protein
LTELGGVRRFDLNRSHDGIADRVERNEKRSRFLAEAGYRPHHTGAACSRRCPPLKE